MRSLLLTTIAIVTLALGASARLCLDEPDCCKAKDCHHSIGEDKHHTCNRHCHDDKQPDGKCCQPHMH
jgi:hypothetical protein